MKARALALPVALAIAAPGGLLAQSVRATLVEAGSDLAIAGAMASLVDSTGAATDADVTDGAGRVVLTAPRPGRYRLLVERVGFATGATPLFDLSGDDPLELRVPVPVRPIELDLLSVESDAVCRPDRVGDRPAAVLWEEARKALDRVVWSRGRGGVRFEIRLFDRRLSKRARVVHEEADTIRVEGIRPFDTAAPEVLASEGFVRATDEDTLYFGPDAEVLLSDAFARTHCFQTVPGERPGRVGLAFEPLDRRRSDIRGVLWLDEATAELRVLEFAYTGPIAGAVAEEHRGRMAFRRLPSGRWIVDEWWIRLPRYSRPLVVTGRGTRHVSGRRRLRHEGWRERGGSVIRIEETS